MTTFSAELDSALGTLTLTATSAGLSGVSVLGHRPCSAPEAGRRREPERFADAVAQLTEYLEGRRTRFDLALDPSAGTPFQRRVWAALDEIPYGATESYGALAFRVGAPSAARAVGAANARNPLSIVRPCHRVVGADGSLTGYGGGLPAKRALLALESGGAALSAPGRLGTRRGDDRAGTVG